MAEVHAGSDATGKSEGMEPGAQGQRGGPLRVSGVCHVIFCFDIGFQVALDQLAQRLGEASRVRTLRVRRPSPAWFEYEPSPVGVVLAGNPVEVEDWITEANVDALVYDFGGVAIRYRIPFTSSPDALVQLGAALYDNEAMHSDARSRVDALRRDAGNAIEQSVLSELSEDYVVYAVREWGDASPDEVLKKHAPAFARLLQAEQSQLSDDRVIQALAARIGYTPSDLSVIDWNAAILFDTDPDDILAVLTHANIELLEMRLLDGQLDGLLTRAHDLMGRLARRSTIWPGMSTGREIRRFAELQTDSALLFEGVNNAIKLIGDQHLARVYTVTSDRLNLPQWDTSVLRKLAVAESIYQKMSDAAGTRRMEILEWIIILLIFISIIMPFIGLGY